MQKSRKIIPVLLLSLLVSGCGSAGGEGSGADIFTDTQTWVDSDLIGAISAEDTFRLQDDFAAAVNREWKLSRGDQYYGLLDDASGTVTQGKQRIVTDPSLGGETGDVLRRYYTLASDWEERGRDGMEPIRPYIEDIEGISDMDGLYTFLFDIKRNPLMIAPLTTELGSIIGSERTPGQYVAWFAAPELSMTGSGRDNSAYFNLNDPNALERYEQVENETAYLLKRYGYSEKEAAALLKRCMEFERRVAEANNEDAASEPVDITFDKEKALKLAGGYPLGEQLACWNMDDAKEIMLLPDYAKRLDSLCAPGNLERIKAFLIVNYFLRTSRYFDRETYDKMEEYQKPRQEEAQDFGTTAEQDEAELMFDLYIGQTPMCGAMNQVYVENFFDETAVADLESMTEDMLAHFKTMFENEEWMSKEGRKACVDKLEAIKVHIAFQDFDSVDYSTLVLRPKEEGGSFLEAYFESLRFGEEHMAWLLKQPYEREYWDPMEPDCSTTITNAFYKPTANGIFINAGVCVAPVYAKEMPYEQKLAGLFTIVGHEITHGFDANGVLYDKEGRNESWLPSQDATTFADRSDKVGIYYTTKKPFPGSGLYPGQNVKTEATADMGGIKITLMMAKDHEGFDYDDYFRSYAKLWRSNIPQKEEEARMNGDVHPLAFYRINVGLQQFDEFYETYDIRETDGMYVKPDDRIKVW